MDINEKYIQDAIHDYFTWGKEKTLLNGLDSLPDNLTDDEIKAVALNKISECLEIRNVSPSTLTALIQFYCLCVKYYLDGRKAGKDSK